MDGMDGRIACPDLSVAGDVNPYLNAANCVPRPVACPDKSGAANDGVKKREGPIFATNTRQDI